MKRLVEMAVTAVAGVQRRECSRCPRAAVGGVHSADRIPRCLGASGKVCGRVHKRAPVGEEYVVPVCRKGRCHPTRYGVVLAGTWLARVGGLKGHSSYYVERWGNRCCR